MHGYEVDLELADGTQLTEEVQAPGAFTAVAIVAQRLLGSEGDGERPAYRDGTIPGSIRAIRGVRRRFITREGSYPVTTVRKRG